MMWKREYGRSPSVLGAISNFETLMEVKIRDFDVAASALAPTRKTQQGGCLYHTGHRHRVVSMRRNEE